jgi:hypothetical protein
MNKQQRDELNEILAALLTQHKVRRDRDIDQQARNLSVHVAERLQKQRPARWYVMGGLATSAAAALVVFAVSTTTETPSTDTSATSTVAAVTTQPVSSPVSAGTNAAAAASTSIGRAAPRAATPSDERILEQEAERQVVEFLAATLVEEDTWTVNNNDIDRLLQENDNDAGL